MQETRVQSLGWEDPLEKEMAIHSSTIAWKIPWTEEPGRLQPMGSQRVGHDWATSRSGKTKDLFQFCCSSTYDSSAGKESTCNARDLGSIPRSGRSTGEEIGDPLQYSWASLEDQLVKKSTCNVGNLDSIPGLGRSPGEGKGYPLEYSGLENPMDCIAKSGTQLSNFPLLIGFQILSRHFNLDDLLI